MHALARLCQVITVSCNYLQHIMSLSSVAGGDSTLFFPLNSVDLEFDAGITQPLVMVEGNIISIGI